MADPAIIIRQCDEALEEAIPCMKNNKAAKRVMIGTETLNSRALRKCRRARGMIKEYENGETA